MKKKFPLHLQIFVSLILGVLFGSIAGEYVSYVSWAGDLFIRALKMVVIPLVFSSIVTGVLGIGSSELGKLGTKTMLYYLSTSFLAILVGLIMVNIIQPGVGADLGFAESVEGLEAAQDGFGSTLMNIIPTNIFSAFSTGKMLSIIFFALLFGLFLSKIESQGKVLKSFFDELFEVMMKVTNFIIAFTPYGVFAIVAKVVAEALEKGTLSEIAGRLGLYAMAVVLALGVHALISLPLILKLVGKVSPLAHFKVMLTPLLNAFSTASSSATLPLTMEAVEKKAGVSNKVTSFTLPLGATINMDGTALYECVAAIFIAQAYGVELGVIQQFVVVLTALLASIGAAGIPMAGLVMMSVILSAVGLPLEGVGLILAVDRILDMCRTAVNVWSDSCGAVLIAKTEKEELAV